MTSLRGSLPRRGGASLLISGSRGADGVSVGAVAILVLALIAGIGFWLQARTFVNHDVAWTLWGADKMLHGAAFGRDIVEPNPPLIWFLSMPAALVGERLHLPLDQVFRSMVGLAALISIAISYAILRKNVQTSDVEAWAFALVAALYMLVFCYRDFGQREHIAQILSLPYVIAAAARIEERRLSTIAGALVGVMAAIGLAQKPYFLAVPLCVELVVVWRTRDLAAPFRAETAAIGAAIVAYVGVIIVATPAYLTDVVPMAERVYWAFNLPLSRVLAGALPQLAALALCAFLLIRGGKSALTAVIVAAAGGFACQYVAQMKAFTYHLLPLTATVALSLTAVAFSLARAGLPTFAAASLAALATLFAGSTSRTYAWWQDDRPGGRHATETQALIDTVRENARGGYFAAVSTRPYPGFPVALYSQSDWSLRTSNQLFLPAVVRLRGGERGGDPKTLAFAEHMSHAFMLRDLALEPGVVIIDAMPERLGIGANRFDFLSFYLEDPDIRKAWAAYHEVAPIGGYRIFLRNSLNQPH